MPDADDLAAIERDRLRALVERDMDRAAELHADDFELITPSGRRLSKAEYLAAVRTRDIDYWSWEAGEIELREHGDVAAVRYPAEMTFRGPDGPRSYRSVCIGCRGGASGPRGDSSARGGRGPPTPRSGAPRARGTLRQLPEADRPAQEALDPDYDPWAGYEWPDRSGDLDRAPRRRSG